ncbi:MAG: hypothetical protein KDE04_00080 [Anaerolineales bacterium]|nr:hypothetical protein [Anaerolineales bacterium]
MAVEKPVPGKFAVTESPNAAIPPIYTYWGQFIDHELTARTDRDESLSIQQDADCLLPTSRAEVVGLLQNGRTPDFDLDCLYGEPNRSAGVKLTVAQKAFARLLRDPHDEAKMRLGINHDVGNITPPHNDIQLKRDLPRLNQILPSDLDNVKALGKDPSKPQMALIGDPRNDENLIVAQFHTAMLHFHNAVVDWRRMNEAVATETPQVQFERARKVVCWVFQWLVVNDFLPTVALPVVVEDVLASEARHYLERMQQLKERFMPLEFSTAGFRFGHSMIRNAYDYNRNFGRGAVFLDKATLDLLFQFTGGHPFPSVEPGKPSPDSLPSNWIIEWDRFTGEAPLDDSDGQPARFARAIDTFLAPPLAELMNEGRDGNPAFQRLLKQLAQRNLRRGHLLSIPSGQDMAEFFGLTPLTPAELRRDTTLSMQYVLDKGGFLQQTPLWFYLLKEAELGGGNSLGLLGSTIVAETIIGVMQADKEAYLAVDKSWHPGRPVPGATQKPLLATGNGTRIADLLRFARVLA